MSGTQTDRKSSAARYVFEWGHLPFVLGCLREGANGIGPSGLLDGEQVGIRWDERVVEGVDPG